MNINIHSIEPSLKINEIDIDRFDLYKNKYKKYDNDVPVLALEDIDSGKRYELPRVSPRLKDLQLKNWLEKNINNILIN